MLDMPDNCNRVAQDPLALNRLVLEIHKTRERSVAFELPRLTVCSIHYHHGPMVATHSHTKSQAHPSHSNLVKAGLSRPKRVGLQKRAQREGVKANARTEDDMGNSMQEHHPLRVPSGFDLAGSTGATDATAATTQSGQVLGGETSPDDAQVTIGESVQPSLEEKVGKEEVGAEAGGGAEGFTWMEFAGRCDSPSVASSEGSVWPKPQPLWAFFGARRKAWVQLRDEVATKLQMAAHSSVTGGDDVWPTLKALQFAVKEVAPFAEVDAEVRDSLRELALIVDFVERQAAMVREKTERLQRIRLALEIHFFTKIKEDPRLTDGTWVRPTEERVARGTEGSAMEGGATMEHADADQRS
ncbi:hypothetical protein BC628DRAFT_287 [Trametes gibbosa]|nr:hypothetical protein BC628DRAFT_287 [Trametes gibbosa]